MLARRGRRWRGLQAAAATSLISAHVSNARPRGAVLDGGDVVAAEVEEVGDLVVGGEEALGLPG